MSIKWLTAIAACMMATATHAQYYVGGCGLGNCQGTQGPLQLQPQQVPGLYHLPPGPQGGVVYSNPCISSNGCGNSGHYVPPGSSCCGTVYLTPRPIYRRR